MGPSSLLSRLLDELTERGLVERRTKPDDRRSNHLFLTDEGRSVYVTVQRLTLELDNELLSPLGKKERQSLEALMQRLARHHGLLPGVHPAYAAAGVED